jgi:hypothetical protein
MKRLLWNGLAVVGGAAVVLLLLNGLTKILSEDEAPIRVRNGSIDILPGVEDGNTWTWMKENNGDHNESAPSWSHEPDDGYLDRETTLWVKVIPTQNSAMTCTSGPVLTGQQVAIEFKDGTNTVTARIKRARSGLYNYRTKVRRQEDFTLNGQYLRYGTAGAGYISEVRIASENCTFTKADDLNEIRICSSAHRQECK